MLCPTQHTNDMAPGAVSRRVATWSATTSAWVYAPASGENPTFALRVIADTPKHRHRRLRARTH